MIYLVIDDETLTNTLDKLDTLSSAVHSKKINLYNLKFFSRLCRLSSCRLERERDHHVAAVALCRRRFLSSSSSSTLLSWRETRCFLCCRHSCFLTPIVRLLCRLYCCSGGGGGSRKEEEEASRRGLFFLFSCSWCCS